MTTIPRWKKWLSHIIELELEKIETGYGHTLSLCVSDGRFQLNAENAIYSWEDKYDNFYKAFLQLDLSKLPGKESLVLGFGLGSIPQMLEKNFNQSLYYTGVEIDDQVIFLAYKYICHQLESPLQLIQASAEIFVEITEEKFDFICVDIFINDEIPTPIKTPVFIEQVKSCLNEDGLVLFNHLANREAERKTGEAFFNNAFRSVFPDAELLDVDGNYIFVSDERFLTNS